jgi:hypothetical protein
MGKGYSLRSLAIGAQAGASRTGDCRSGLEAAQPFMRAEKKERQQLLFEIIMEVFMRHKHSGMITA